MWTRSIAILAVILCWAASAPADLQEWAERSDRILLVLLADGLDPDRVAPKTARGEPLCPELADWRAQSLRYLDVQSGCPDREGGLAHLFGESTPVLRPLEELDSWAREIRSTDEPTVAVFTTDLFSDVQPLDVNQLLEYDPVPWLGAGVRDDDAAIARKRRSRASQILGQLKAGRALRSMLPEPERQWVPDTLHRRGDRALAEWWTALERSAIAERCLVVLTARSGAEDPLRVGTGQSEPPRPELLRVPFWIRGDPIAPSTDSTSLRSGSLMAALLEAHRTGEWAPPAAEPLRWSTRLAREGDDVDASVWIRHEDWSLHLNHDGREAVYDRSVDPEEWDDLASTQGTALAALRQRCAQSLVGSLAELRIHNASGRPLLMQPPEAIVASSGGEPNRLGHAVELVGEGPFTIQFDPAIELKLRAPGEAVPLWQFADGDPWAARQIHLRLGRYEFFAALTQEAPADASASSPLPGSIRLELSTVPGAMDLLR